MTEEQQDQPAAPAEGAPAEGGDGAADKAQDALADVADKAKDLAEDVVDKAKDLAEQAKDALDGDDKPPAEDKPAE